MTAPGPEWPATLVEFIDVVDAELRRQSLRECAPDELARRVVFALAMHCGGRPVYLPRGCRMKTAMLHDAIYREANGRNTTELASRHNITVRAVQRIVAEQGRLRRAHPTGGRQ